MADPISIAVYTLMVSNKLLTTVRHFKRKNKRVRTLQYEVDNLVAVLTALLNAMRDGSDTDFRNLVKPLEQCGKVCEEYQRLILRAVEQSSDPSQFSLMDSVKIQYLGGDIDDFRGLLSAYRATINIALANIHIRTTKLSPGELGNYNDLMVATTEGLEEHLQRLDAKIENVNLEAPDPPQRNSEVLQGLLEEKQGLQQGLAICAQLLEKMKLLKTATDNSRDTSQQPSAYDITQESLHTIETTLRNLESRLSRLIQKFQNVDATLTNTGASKQMEKSEEAMDIRKDRLVCPGAQEVLAVSRRSSVDETGSNLTTKMGGDQMVLRDSIPRTIPSQLQPSTSFDEFEAKPDNCPSGFGSLHPTGLELDINFIHGLTGNRDITSAAEEQGKSLPELLPLSAISNARDINLGFKPWVQTPEPSTSPEPLYSYSHSLAHMAATESAESYSHLSSLPCVQESSNTSAMPCLPDIMENSPQQQYTDIESIYTSDVPESQEYVQELAVRLFEEFECLEPESLDRILAILPDVLGGFARRIAGEGQRPEYFEVMKFIHKTRRHITVVFEKYYSRAYGVMEHSDRNLADGMLLEEKLSRWQVGSVLEDPNFESQPPPDADFLQQIDDQDCDDDDIISSRFRYIVADSTSFKWLCAQLHRELALTTSEARAMQNVAARIRQELSCQHNSSLMSSKKGPQLYSATFCSSWKPRLFAAEQGYLGPAEDAIEGAITIVQSSNNQAEAMPCSEYLGRTWPLIGESFMALVKHVVCSRPGVRCSVTVFDNTKLTAWLDSTGSLVIQADGTKETIVDIGEMYAWVVAAVRAAPGDTITSVFPVLQCGANRPEVIFNVNICTQHSEDFSSSEGQCWHSLFGNPVVVQGFPVTRHSPGRRPGLELSLAALAALLGTQHIAVFCGNLFLKGFCTLLVPTGYVGDTVYWHALFNADGSRIAFTDQRARNVAGDFDLAKHLTLSGIETARHVVGWCETVRDYTGSKEANYTIRPSGLQPPGSQFVFDRVSISAGKIITIGFSGLVLKKDKPARAVRASDYHRQLDWIEKHYVVLFDTEDRRAWLVDGLSALLHLVRAALVHRRNNRPGVIFGEDDIQESSTPYRGKPTSYDVLLNRANMDLTIFERWSRVVVEEARKEGDTITETIRKRQRTWYQFPDLVGDIFVILSMLLDIQTDTSTEDGFGAKIRKSPRKQLEGWDFTDVANDASIILPKVAKLDKPGWGWVDLSRAINAITLFGAGFGDILQPTPAYQQDRYESNIPRQIAAGTIETTLCIKWAKLPDGADLLATTTAIIRDIMKHVYRGPDYDDKLWELFGGIYWHKPDKAFESCNCASNGTKCDRVQVLLPTRFPNLFARGCRSPSNPLPHHGGVIFGQSLKLPLRKPSTHPAPSQEPLTVARWKFSSNQSDSGLGTSLRSSDNQSSSRNQSSSSQLPSLQPSYSRSRQPTSSQPSSNTTNSSKGKKKSTKRVLGYLIDGLKTRN